MMSLSGSSLSRNSSCAMMMLATSSSTARAEEDDAVLEQAGEDVPAALAAVGLLDDRRDDEVANRGRGSRARSWFRFLFGAFLAALGLAALLRLRLFRRDDQRRRFFVGDLSLRRSAYQASSLRGSGSRAWWMRLSFSSSARSCFGVLVWRAAASSAMRFCRSASVTVEAFALGDRLDQDRAARLLFGLVRISTLIFASSSDFDVDAHHRAAAAWRG